MLRFIVSNFSPPLLHVSILLVFISYGTRMAALMLYDLNKHLLFCLLSIGVCQANDIDGTDASIISGWHKNSTVEHHGKRPPTAHSHQPHAVKGECLVGIY